MLGLTCQGLTREWPAFEQRSIWIKHGWHKEAGEELDLNLYHPHSSFTKTLQVGLTCSPNAPRDLWIQPAQEHKLTYNIKKFYLAILGGVVRLDCIVLKRALCRLAVLCCSVKGYHAQALNQGQGKRICSHILTEDFLFLSWTKLPESCSLYFWLNVENPVHPFSSPGKLYFCHREWRHPIGI